MEAGNLAASVTAFVRPSAPPPWSWPKLPRPFYMIVIQCGEVACQSLKNMSLRWASACGQCCTWAGTQTARHRLMDQTQTSRHRLSKEIRCACSSIVRTRSAPGCHAPLENPATAPLTHRSVRPSRPFLQVVILCCCLHRRIPAEPQKPHCEYDRAQHGGRLPHCLWLFPNTSGEARWRSP